MINVANAVAKWARNVQGAQQSYREGVQAVTENPMALAAAQAEKALSRYSDAITSGRWAQRLQSTPMEFWKSQSASAAAKYAQGAAKGTPKIQAHLTKFAPIYEQARQAARAVQGSGEAAAAEKMLVVRRMLRAAAGKPAD